MDLLLPKCVGCGLAPDEIQEYVEMAKLEQTTPIKFVKSDEGTYNRANGHFACTACYLRMGAPSAPQGWVAP